MRSSPLVLIVDDQVDLRLLIRLTFSDMGYTVQEASDGAAALAACALEVPDVVLLDVMMPGIDGHEVCRRLRADARCDRTLIVMLTAADQSSQRPRGDAAQADLYVTKPFSPAGLLQLVTSTLRSRHD